MNPHPYNKGKMVKGPPGVSKDFAPSWKLPVILLVLGVRTGFKMEPALVYPLLTRISGVRFLPHVSAPVLDDEKGKSLQR